MALDKRDSYIIKMFIISALVIIFIIISWIYVIYESKSYKENIIRFFGNQQEGLLYEVVKDIKINSQQDVVSVIKNAVKTENRYGFLFISDQLVFENDETTTDILKEETVAELVKKYRINGGEDVNTFEELMKNGVNGTCVFSKSNKSGTEITSVKFFTINDIHYVAGISTKLDYVIKTSNTNQKVIQLYLLTVVFNIVILIVSLLLCLLIYRHSKKIIQLEDILSVKNIQIEELDKELTDVREDVRKASVFDILTGLYNRKFFDTLLPKMNEDIFQPVSMIALNINGFNKINKIMDFSAGDKILIKISEILKNVCAETDIISRTNNNEFIITMINTEEADAYEIVNTIDQQFKSTFNQIEVSLSFGVSQSYEKDIYIALERVYKNLRVHKMTDKNSSKSKLISLFMESLIKYTGETEEHCNRIKEYAVEIGKVLGMNSADLARLEIAALLHDIGKISFPDSISFGEDLLSFEEREIVQKHSEIGYHIAMTMPGLDQVAADILQHHEKYDGTGYPNGLKGEGISLNARIISVLDSFDAMVNNQLYSKVKTEDEAIRELMKDACKYDTRIMQEFFKIVKCR